MTNPVSKTTISAYFCSNNTIKGIAGVPASKTTHYFSFLKHFRATLSKDVSIGLYVVTKSPQTTSIIHEGEPLHSACSKIKKYLHTFLLTRTMNGHPTLNYFTEIRCFITNILDLEDSEKRMDAFHALICMEKSDPSLHSLNYEISCFLNSSSEEGRKRSFNRLYAFSRTLLQPMQMHFPIKPCIPKNAFFLPTPITFSHLIHREVHDAFWHVEQIMVGHEAGCYIDNLTEIAEKEGISQVIDLAKLAFVPEIEWARDAMIILENGELLIPSRINLLHPDDQLGFFFTPPRSKFSHLITKLCSHDFAEGILGSVADDFVSSKMLKSDIQGIREAPFYFEGGNLIPAINQAGERIYLCGANNILFSVLNSHFILSDHKKELLEEVKSLEVSPYKLLFIQERLENAGLLTKFSSSREKEWIAKLTIASIKSIEKQMARTLGCPVIVIGDVFQPPIEFHLDMFLLPAPEGVVFIQDFELCKTVLTHTLQSYSLSDEERKQLLMYLEESERLQKIHGEKLKAVTLQLYHAGFHVVSVPGAYYEKTKKGRAVNLLNAIMGIGKAQRFCISNGSSHPADRFLRDAFTSILNAHGIAHVYFTGKATKKDVWEPVTPNAYPDADKSIKNLVGGVHCRTQEISRLNKDFTLTKNTSPRQNREFNETFVGESLPEFYKEMLLLEK